MPTWKWIVEFFELRPVYTLRMVQVFWWLYIAERLYGTSWRFLQTYPSRPAAYRLYDWTDMFFRPLQTLVTLATVRLLLDVLLALVLPSSRQAVPGAPTIGRELLAFLDLRPFFTRWWVQVFWWLYLLTLLRSVYPLFVFNPPWVYAASPADWLRFLNALLDKLPWLIGVRLLVEAALVALPPPPIAARRTNP